MYHNVDVPKYSVIVMQSIKVLEKFINLVKYNKRKAKKEKEEEKWKAGIFSFAYCCAFSFL